MFMICAADNATSFVSYVAARKTNPIASKTSMYEWFFKTIMALEFPASPYYLNEKFQED